MLIEIPWKDSSMVQCRNGPNDVPGHECFRTPRCDLFWRSVISVIREPKGVDFIVAEGHLSRKEVLETAEWLNYYRQRNDQSAELQRALRILHEASERRRTASDKTEHVS